MKKLHLISDRLSICLLASSLWILFTAGSMNPEQLIPQKNTSILTSQQITSPDSINSNLGKIVENWPGHVFLNLKKEEPDEIEKKANLAFIFSVTGFFTGFGFLIGIILGIIVLNKINKSGNKEKYQKAKRKALFAIFWPIGTLVLVLWGWGKYASWF